MSSNHSRSLSPLRPVAFQSSHYATSSTDRSEECRGGYRALDTSRRCPDSPAPRGHPYLGNRRSRGPHSYSPATDSDDDSKENSHGFASIVLAVPCEVASTVYYQMQNWYTRLVIFCGFLLMLLLTLVMLVVAGYFDMSTW